jgi:hypothetical protein
MAASLAALHPKHNRWSDQRIVREIGITFVSVRPEPVEGLYFLQNRTRLRQALLSKVEGPNGSYLRLATLKLRLLSYEEGDRIVWPTLFPIVDHHNPAVARTIISNMGYEMSKLAGNVRS